MGVMIPQVITPSKASGAQVIDGSLKFERSVVIFYIEYFLLRVIEEPGHGLDGYNHHLMDIIKDFGVLVVIIVPQFLKTIIGMTVQEHLPLEVILTLHTKLPHKFLEILDGIMLLLFRTQQMQQLLIDLDYI